MSIHVISWALKHSNATGNDRMALIVFADHADDEGWETYPGAPTIAHEGRMAVSTARIARKRLVEQGRLIPDGFDPYGKRIPKFRVRMDVEAEGPPPELPDKNAWREGLKPDPQREGQDSEGEGLNAPGEGLNDDASEGPAVRPKPSLVNRPSEPSSKNAEQARRFVSFLAASTKSEPPSRLSAKMLANSLYFLREVDHAEIKAVVAWAATSSYWAPKAMDPNKLRRWWKEMSAAYHASRNGSSKQDAQTKLNRERLGIR
jgi:hypothetical protein